MKHFFLKQIFLAAGQRQHLELFLLVQRKVPQKKDPQSSFAGKLVLPKWRTSSAIRFARPLSSILISTFSTRTTPWGPGDFSAWRSEPETAAKFCRGDGWSVTDSRGFFKKRSVLLRQTQTSGTPSFGHISWMSKKGTNSLSLQGFN